ncbi:hypothetical protein E4O86_14815, partial [Rhizobiales bacterium L72]|nr:hypothetical protein [Propylenella binzhouense]
MRTAIYFVPPPDHPLARAAAGWLGRDVETGAATAQPRLPDLSGEELAALTAEPRRYGFHATLKAPFRLAEPWRLEDLAEALAAFGASRAPVDL